jgi:hypothetical protein
MQRFLPLVGRQRLAESSRSKPSMTDRRLPLEPRGARMSGEPYSALQDGDMKLPRISIAGSLLVV